MCDQIIYFAKGWKFIRSRRFLFGDSTEGRKIVNHETEMHKKWCVSETYHRILLFFHPSKIRLQIFFRQEQYYHQNKTKSLQRHKVQFFSSRLSLIKCISLVYIKSRWPIFSTFSVISVRARNAKLHLT